jgi:hypothetical protein
MPQRNKPEPQPSLEGMTMKPQLEQFRSQILPWTERKGFRP